MRPLSLDHSGGFYWCWEDIGQVLVTDRDYHWLASDNGGQFGGGRGGMASGRWLYLEGFDISGIMLA